MKWRLGSINYKKLCDLTHFDSSSRKLSIKSCIALLGLRLEKYCVSLGCIGYQIRNHSVLLGWESNQLSK